MLRFSNLASGSKGNATVVQARDKSGFTTHLLVDCGLSRKELFHRLLLMQVNPEELNGIFITHEHADHIGSAFQVALELGIPIFMSKGTWRACYQQRTQSQAGLIHSQRAELVLEQGLLKVIADEERFRLHGIEVTPVTVPHDAKEPLQLTCSDGQAVLGILTDLGHISSHVHHHFSKCTALMLECNHDVPMLSQSNYPPFLRQRIGGDFGHLSNEQSTHALGLWVHNQLKNILCAHLSEQNNHPDLVRHSVSKVLGCSEKDVLCANAQHTSPWLAA